MKSSRSANPARLLCWFTGPIIAFNLVFLFWLVAKPAPEAIIIALADWGEATASSIVAIAFFVMTYLLERRYPSHMTRSQRLATTCMVLGTLSYAIGGFIWSYYEEVLHQAPFPSLADAAYLATYPLLLVAILCLPTRRIFASARVRIVLDSMMIMVAVVTGCWYFMLGPTVLTRDGSMVAKIVGSTYPLADLVLVCCTLLILYRAGDRRLRQPMRLLALALLLILVAHSVFDNLLLNNSYTSGSILDICWTIGYMLIVVAALQMRLIWLRDAQTGIPAAQDETVPEMLHKNGGLLHAALPYVLVPLIVVLVGYAYQTHGDEHYVVGVYVGATIWLALIFVRQIFAIREMIALNQQAQRLNQTLQDLQLDLLEQHTALTQANAQLAAMATTDPLTGLPNHRALVDALDRELDRARRQHQVCAVIFLDLDHFKAVNDTYGHPAGDAVLREFGSVVRQVLRECDTLGRWGGEEFIAILPATDFDGLRALAERMRAAVAEHTFAIGGGLGLTCSLGLALFSSDAHDRDSLVQAADNAMYAAKKLGRDQVRTFRDPLVAEVSHSADEAISREGATIAGTVDALTKLLEARDAPTAAHTQLVAEHAMIIARALGLDHRATELVGQAGRLHDLGKISVPDAVLRKPARFSAEEQLTMRQHPLIGAEVISLIPALRGLAPIIRAHHERWDGHGYPDGLAGESIPLAARIVTVADAFTVMVADRPYQPAQDLTYAVAELRRCAGSQFDPRVVDALVNHLASQASPEIAA